MGKIGNWFHHLLNFLAVIIGVYLGFYINDSAQLAKEEYEAELMMTSIASDLSGDLDSYADYQIPFNKNYLLDLDSINQALSAKDLSELNRLLPGLFQVNNYTPSSSTYNSLKSSGKIKLIKNLKLQQNLSYFYDGVAMECRQKNEIQVEYFVDEIVHWLTENANLSEMTINPQAPLVVFQNKILIYQSLVQQKVAHYEMIVEDSEGILQLLN